MGEREIEEVEAITFTTMDAEAVLCGVLIWGIEKATFRQQFSTLLTTGWMRNMTIYQQALDFFLRREDGGDMSEDAKNSLRSWVVEKTIDRLCFAKAFDLEKAIADVKPRVAKIYEEVQP